MGVTVFSNDQTTLYWFYWTAVPDVGRQSVSWHCAIKPLVSTKFEVVSNLFIRDPQRKVVDTL